MMELDTIFCGDALDARTLPDNSVHCCITCRPIMRCGDYGMMGRSGARRDLRSMWRGLTEVFFRGSARASSKRHALAEHCGYLLRHRQQRRPSGPEESKRQERTGCIACAASGKCQSKGYADGSGYEARFTQCGICTLMKKLGLYDRTLAMCHLDYTMSEAGGASNFVRGSIRSPPAAHIATAAIKSAAKVGADASVRPSPAAVK